MITVSPSFTLKIDFVPRSSGSLKVCPLKVAPVLAMMTLGSILMVISPVRMLACGVTLRKTPVSTRSASCVVNAVCPSAVVVFVSSPIASSVEISISPFGAPAEFEVALSSARIHDGGFTFAEFAETKIRAYLAAYPTVDVISLRLPPRATAKQHLELLTLLKNDVLGDSNLLRTPSGHKVDLVVENVHPALYPVLDDVLPVGAAVLNRLASNARRAVQKRERLSDVPTAKVPSRLVLTVGDVSLGILSQSATRRLETLLKEIRRGGWQGFEARCPVLGEMDPSIHYLSRAAFDSQVTPRSAHDDFFVAITGKASPAERLWRGLGHIEAATELLDNNAPGLTRPAGNMLMKHYRSSPLPAWWTTVARGPSPYT